MRARLLALWVTTILSACNMSDLPRRTIVYKRVGGCEIKADVFRLPGKDIRPAIIWLHGGGLIAGCRDMLGAKATREQLTRYAHAGFVVIAVDYRLAPETKLGEILEDVRDAYGWTRAEGARQFGIDSDRIALVGHSAGGYLALLGGMYLEPRPKAIVSFYGYGDITGDWCTRPAAYFREKGLVLEEDARASVGDEIISQACYPTTRNRFYEYCRQRGLWTKAVTGLDPSTDSTLLMRFCPLTNVTADYPPTLLLHGDKDNDVPYAQSVRMAEKLELAGVKHRLITLVGRDHGFDYTNWQDQEVSDSFDSVIAFLRTNLGAE